MYKILKAETLAAKISSYGCTCTACCKPLSARTVHHRQNGREG